jgi:hypothetical protein
MIFLSAILLVGVFLCAASPAATTDEGETDEKEVMESFDFRYDIPSMIRMNPDFSTYPGSNGVIWMKKLNYGIAPDGGMERRSQWILLGRKGLAPRWLTWNVPRPRGGEVEFLESSVYSPQGGGKIMDVAPVDFEQGGGVSVAFTGLPDTFILVVSWRELFPERLTVEDFVWTSEPLPVWEQLVGVTVPAGHPFYIASSPEATPREEEVDDRRVCEWQIINTASDAQNTPRAGSRGYIAFGMREGRETAARVLRAFMTAPFPPVPDAVRRARGSGADAGGVEKCLKWLYGQPEFVLPDGAWREIPANAPWTKREKLLLAYNWLKGAGVDVRLFWRLPRKPEKDQPACEGMAIAPVLEIPALDSKKGAFYCDMEYLPDPGENPFSLQGQTIYGLTPDNAIEERRIPGSSAAKNRLSATFNLRLSEEGILSGTIRLSARDAWRRLLFPSGLTSDDLASTVTALFPQALRYTGLTMRDRTGESELVVTLAEVQAIRSAGRGEGGSNILASLPALMPNWFEAMSKGPWPWSLRFPFLLDAKITVVLPSSTLDVMLPAPTERNMGKIKYTDSWKLNKKRTLSAEAHMTVAITTIEDESAANLNAALQGWRLFMTRNLPVRLKSKK